MARPRGAPPASGLRRVLHPLQRRLETIVHPLRYLFLEITQRCNLACLHCGSDCGRAMRAGELSTDEWLSLFAYLADHAPIQRMVLVITGGEPLCHPELDRLLLGLRRHGLTWGMVTNGYALSDAALSRLRDAGVASMTVSLDGLEESHDWLRGVAGSFERATAAIERLARADRPFFDVVTCVSPRNLGELPRVRALLRELGARAWRLFCIFPRGRARQRADLRLSASEYRRLLSFIEEARCDGGGPQVQLSCEGYLPWHLDRRVRDEPYFCRAGVSIASVLCDGAISACPNLPRSLIQGNIRGDDLMSTWERRFDPFRRRDWMRRGPCVACREWRRCLGNSLHLWDETAGQIACCTLALATRE